MTSLLLPTFFLITFGFFNLLGINQTSAINQLFNFVLGFIVFFIIKKIGYRFFKNNSLFFYWFFVGLILLTFFIGISVKGSKRWINLYFTNFQSSEFFKVFFIIFLADFFSKVDKKVNDLKIFIQSFFYFILPTFAIFKQPDLGNAIIVSLIYLTLLIFSGIPKKYLFCLFSAIIISLPVGWLSLKSYQKERIISFFSPEVDSQGTAYNMTQAVITIGSGRFFGRGLGKGTQSQLLFLPENQTDFAFASLVEQFGFFGGFLVIFLYFIMAVKLIKKIIKYYYQKSKEGIYNFLFNLGIFGYLIYQVFINIGMNLGLMPVAGVALPFISYGGSAFTSLMIGFALLP
ncbi:MAG: FtsW/RodA/SpoVE family cell cycle protein [Microgenomates group bacterium]|nr:FtsW/RodA/SpoVE family cell cycle protein [Microgenomates group bacterium]